MQAKFVILPALGLIANSFVSGQPAQQRWAIIAAHGPAANSNPGIANAEARVTDDLTAQLTGLPGVALIDRASIDKVLKEQNFQNSDRSSADTAVRIGKLLGVGQMVLVQVFDYSYTTHPDQSGGKTRTMGTIVLRANARMIDVETGVIRAQPSAAYQDSVEISETTKSQGFQFGTIRVPPKQTTHGGDPKVIADNEWAKADNAVVKDLAAKLSGSIPPPPARKLESALVAGIVNGAVFINRGSTIGIKAGDRFQIIRDVNVGLNDPETGKPMLQKQRVCVLTIERAEESNASGSCQGGLPQAKDVAEPLQ
jgi:hypothetical protein